MDVRHVAAIFPAIDAAEGRDALGDLVDAENNHAADQ